MPCNNSDCPAVGYDVLTLPALLFPERVVFTVQPVTSEATKMRTSIAVVGFNCTRLSRGEWWLNYSHSFFPPPNSRAQKPTLGASIRPCDFPCCLAFR